MALMSTLLFWFIDFLSNRTQTVKVGSYLSLPVSVSVTSGVPQGSVFGPIIFLLFINDITDNMNPDINVKLFADDLKVYTKLSHPDSIKKLSNSSHSNSKLGNDMANAYFIQILIFKIKYFGKIKIKKSNTYSK